MLGALAFLAALLVLPWFSAEGEDRTLSDLRSAFEVPATDPNDLPGAGDPTASTLPEGIPSPDDVADAVEEEARDTATTAMAGAIDDGKARYLELYADVLWLPIAAVVAVAAVVSTVLAPRSMALSLLLGVRRIAGAAVVMAGLAHAAALWVVFTGDGAPSPLFGVWLGIAGLVGRARGLRHRSAPLTPGRPTHPLRRHVHLSGPDRRGRQHGRRPGRSPPSSSARSWPPPARPAPDRHTRRDRPGPRPFRARRGRRPSRRARWGAMSTSDQTATAPAAGRPRTDRAWRWAVGLGGAVLAAVAAIEVVTDDGDGPVTSLLVVGAVLATLPLWSTG